MLENVHRNSRENFDRVWAMETGGGWVGASAAGRRAFDRCPDVQRCSVLGFKLQVMIVSVQVR